MKAVLNFDLSDPSDAIEYKRVNKSLDLALALWEMMYNTKKKVIAELEKEDNTEDKYDAVDRVYEKLWEVLNEHSINLDDIVE